jgi:CTP:molybdopterin cytidylyltransferase MocA
VASTIGEDNPRTPPVVFSKDFLPRLATLQGDEGARHLMHLAGAVVAPARTLMDFDTAEDFRR